MKLIRILLTLAVVLTMIAAGVLFSLQNTAPVPLDLLVHRFEPQSVSLWVLGALALGGLLGILASSFIQWRLRGKLARAGAERDRALAELDRQRSAVGGKREKRAAAAGASSLP
jgi:putative membrane protein